MILNVFYFMIGVVIVFFTLNSAIKTFVLPRSAPDQLSRLVFLLVRRLFMLRMLGTRTFPERDRIMALYAPLSLLSLLPVWLSLVLAGYAAIFISLGVESWYEAIRISGSSLLTLGFATADELHLLLLAFSEATIGLILVAVLIAYLPTMYAAFSRREVAVTLLEVRAGNPPSALEMIKRYNRIHGLDHLRELWQTWEGWFVDLEESHTSLAALVFFRSPQPSHSWVTAAGAVLDAASIALAAVDIPHDPQADLCIRAGYLALRQIADFFGIPYHPNPRYPEQPISVTREEFESALAQLAAAGVPLKPDCEQAWRDFAGWRVNYDTVLLSLAGLIMAPEAPWSSDRAIYGQQSLLLHVDRYKPSGSISK